jgi:hypothetical protein
MAEERATCPTCRSSNPFESDLLGNGETLEMDCFGCGKRLAIERGAKGSGIVVRELLKPPKTRPGLAEQPTSASDE